MYLKISGGNNKGSAEQLFSYLTKENEIEGKSDDFFNANLLTGENYADFRNSVHTLKEYKTERAEIGRASVGKECRSRWSPYH